jgi:hypothetical protein
MYVHHIFLAFVSTLKNENFSGKPCDRKGMNGLQDVVKEMGGLDLLSKGCNLDEK